MSDGTYVGRVKHVGPLMEYGESGFKKRILVLTDTRGNREGIVPFELIGDALKGPLPRGGATRLKLPLCFAGESGVESTLLI